MAIGGGNTRRVAIWAFSVAALVAPLGAGAAEISEEGSKVTLHGFLSQAWAKTDGEQYLGITDDGTTDYRNIALQLRFKLAERQSLVFQLGHESRGESPRDALRDDVELDWAFYEAQLGITTVRVGRIPLPLGIYSELRDAGHLLPFYGPPITIYGETSFATESIDGVGVTFNLFRESPWAVDLDVFGGESEFSEKGRASNAITLAQTRDDWGVRAWLNTPVEGLRVGFNHHSFKSPDSKVLQRSATQTADYLSLDWSRERWMVRSEYGKSDIELPFGLNADVDLGYLTLGFSPLPKFWIYLQAETREVAVTPRVQPTRKTFDGVGVSLTYALSERAVLKLEHSSIETTDVERVLTALEVPEVEVTIASISVAF